MGVSDTRQYLLERVDDVAVVQVYADGFTTLAPRENVMTDTAAFREGVGRLLAEVQRIKGEGDYEAARKLIESYGVHFDPALRDEVVARVEGLNLPSYTGFVMPRLEPVVDASGEIADVRISYPLDLTAQMLEYSAATRALR